MARTGRPKAELVLSDVERAALTNWSRRAKTAQALALRSRIVLACADGASNKEVAASLRVVPATVGKWRARFITDRLEGLADEPRPGAARTITDEQVEQVIVKTLEEAPAGGDTHWSTRSMARTLGMSQTAISRIWRAFGLKPHLVDTWKLSKDPQFIDKVRDIVGLYLDPPDMAMVLCVDEKSQMQALDRTAPVLPMMPSVPGRQTSDYIRHGTTSLFAALDIATGKVIGQHQRRHRHQEFLQVRHIPIEVHPVRALQIQRHLTVEEIVDRHRTLRHQGTSHIDRGTLHNAQPAAPSPRTATTHLDGPRRSLFRPPGRIRFMARRKRLRPMGSQGATHGPAVGKGRQRDQGRHLPMGKPAHPGQVQLS